MEASAGRAAALVAQAAALQREAAAVLDELALVSHLSPWGDVIHTGSSRYGLMVARDIDLYVVREAWDAPLCWQALTPIFAHERMQSIRLSKWVGGYASPALPEGHSAVLRSYDRGGAQWRIDVWFFTPEVSVARLGFHRELTGTLPPEVRNAILEIKDAYHTHPDYSSAEVYEAVLHRGVRTAEAYGRGQDGRASGGAATSVLP